jgi:hypothetical protein
MTMKKSKIVMTNLLSSVQRRDNTTRLDTTSLSQLLQDNTRRHNPVFSQLAEQYCDCSKPSACVEVIESDIKHTIPGGGAAGLSMYDWGAWDPVTGVPRIDCPDTVTHAHCKKLPVSCKHPSVKMFISFCHVIVVVCIGVLESIVRVYVCLKRRPG